MAIEKCGARTRQGHPCKLPAGYGTEHLGSGKCKYHGGASKGAPKHNKNSEKHGFFSKYLPEESVSILQDVSAVSPLDLLWDSITLQWTAIIRAQKLMYVRDNKDHTRSRVGFTAGQTIGEKWEVQHAWDKQEQFLNAQSRAINTLGQQIERYDKLCRSPLATEEQKQRIAKLKAEVENLTGVHDEYEDMSDILEEIYGEE
jgi:phage terminase small subunit